MIRGEEVVPTDDMGRFVVRLMTGVAIVPGG